MYRIVSRFLLLFVVFLILSGIALHGQTNIKLKYENSALYAGIDIGAKGVKLSVLEIGKNAQKSGAFNVLKDTAINTDFITFNAASFQATLDGLTKLYYTALKDFKIPAANIFTVVSSGIKMQADKENKQDNVTLFINQFKKTINEPGREVPIIDVRDEARLSHLGIVPDSRRYTTFLIDIGSGNTKGGYFPDGNTRDLKLFQLNWGTKSTANATEKRCNEDKSINNFKKQLDRVLWSAENAEIVYAVNESGAYPMSDNVAFSGGIAWSLATLMYPELIDNSIVPVTYEEVEKFSDKLYANYNQVNDSAILKGLTDNNLDRVAIGREVKRVNQVFDQKSLLAGTGLLLKIMRQFDGVYEKKQFYFVKNGQVGWISAYVDKAINK